MTYDMCHANIFQKDAVGLGGCVLSMLYFETSQEVSNEKVHIKNAEFDEDIGTVFTCHFAAARGYKVITLMEMLLSQLPRTITQPFALSIPVMSLKRYQFGCIYNISSDIVYAFTSGIGTLNDGA